MVPCGLPPGIWGSAPGRRGRRDAPFSRPARAAAGSAVSPGIVLAVLLVAIGAQATRVALPRRGGYVIAVVCAAAGLLAGEVVALSGHGGPTLGTIHPVADALGIALAEACGVALAPSAAGGRR